MRYISWFELFFKNVEQKFNYFIATSIDRQLLNIVNKNFDIFNLFNNNIFSSSDYNFNWKDKIEIFKLSAKKMNTNHKNCLVIEDSPLGIDSANKLWMKTVALETTFDKKYLVKANYIFKDFQTLNSIYYD